jgi:hypothetical protein
MSAPAAFFPTAQHTCLVRSLIYTFQQRSSVPGRVEDFGKAKHVTNLKSVEFTVEDGTEIASNVLVRSILCREREREREIGGPGFSSALRDSLLGELSGQLTIFVFWSQQAVMPIALGDWVCSLFLFSFLSSTRREPICG